MIRSTFGAPRGGTTLAGQKGFDWLAWRLISPPNFGGGGGRYLPSIVVVAPGEPGVPVICCAAIGRTETVAKATDVNSTSQMLLVALMVRSLDETTRRTENGMALVRIDLDQRMSFATGSSQRQVRRCPPSPESGSNFGALAALLRVDDTAVDAIQASKPRIMRPRTQQF
jgi:hypothetical protein